MSAWITATLVANGYHSSSVESSSIVAEVILDSRISHLERERGREGGREGGAKQERSEFQLIPPTLTLRSSKERVK